MTNSQPEEKANLNLKSQIHQTPSHKQENQIQIRQLHIRNHLGRQWHRSRRPADEIALSLASEIAKLHNSSQLRSYTNYHDCYQVIPNTILRLQPGSTLHRLWLAT